MCFHLCCFLHRAAKINLEHFKWRENDLLVEFLSLWVTVIPVYIASGMRSLILKEKYNRHMRKYFSQSKDCEMLFSVGTMYLLLTFSFAIGSLEIVIFCFSGNMDYAGGSAAVCFHIAFCPWIGERLLLSSSAVSPELLC